MFSVTDLQSDPPGWPEDVVEQWLLYFANEPDCGWPPPEPLGDRRWGRLLGGRPLPWWKNVTWQKEKVKCEPVSLSPKARADVADIIAQINNRNEATKRRVAGPWLHIKKNGVFPRAVVTMKAPTGLILLDGSHRMAAFDLVQRLPDAEFEKIGKKRPALEQDVWLGTHPKGELPNGC